MKWINNLLIGKFNKFNVDNVRKLNDTYTSSFNKKQRKYKNKICKEIIKTACCGARSLYTDEENDEDWITEEYLLSLKEYFKSKGFTVQEIHEYAYLRLKISW